MAGSTTSVRDLVTGAQARPARFLVVGAWNTLFGWLAYVGCLAITDRMGLSYLVATVPAQILSIANSYVSQRWLVFHDAKASHASSILRFCAVYGVLYLVNTPLLAVLVSGFHVYPRLASLALTGANALVSYVAHHRFTFRLHGGE